MEPLGRRSERAPPNERTPERSEAKRSLRSRSLSRVLYKVLQLGLGVRFSLTGGTWETGGTHQNRPGDWRGAVWCLIGVNSRRNLKCSGQTRVESFRGLDHPKDLKGCQAMASRLEANASRKDSKARARKVQVCRSKGHTGRLQRCFF